MEVVSFFAPLLALVQPGRAMQVLEHYKHLTSMLKSEEERESSTYPNFITKLQQLFRCARG
jgi:hypothetical protein